ncbi:protein RESISTANCE TO PHYTOPHTHORA 1, chloroplastic [Canna indica]|uniref:Protein RESISTANCE TO PHYTOPHTHORA 1, chloroplastic n=1 Tax=Canna indica TaxID=4628 RepID=A0AAQ3K8I4_9LILI|nr:protein RESISTANCE TO PHYTOPHTHORA 1, chloroplastic [Canna indica]
MYLFYAATPSSSRLPKLPSLFLTPKSIPRSSSSLTTATRLRAEAGSDGVETTATTATPTEGNQQAAESSSSSVDGSKSSAGKPAFVPPVAPISDKEIKKVVQKTAATFAPRASTATKNPAVPGTALYTVFEVQGYASMLLGGALSFNLIFPSNEPDIWRLMGMWSIWMFTIPSLRARDCSKNEKEALNYLFLLVPLLNILIPFLWKSFAVVWSADTIAFFAMYAWKTCKHEEAVSGTPRAYGN